MDVNEPFRRPMFKTGRFNLERSRPMKKLLSGLFVAVFALGSLSAIACSGDKAKDDKQMSTPAKPKV